MFKLKDIFQNSFDNDSLSTAASSEAFLRAVGEYVEPEADESTEETENESEEMESEDINEDTEVETEDGVEDESEDEQENSDEEQSDGSGEEESEDELFLVPNEDGTQTEISGTELLAGYQRQEDYTRKTQAVAEERDKVETYGKELEKERGRYVDAVTAIIEAEEATLSEYDKVDWDKLRVEDTNQFLLLQYELGEKRKALQTKKDALDSATAQREQEAKIKQSQFLEAENARVADLVEGWNGAEHQSIVDGLAKQAEVEGFTEVDNDLFQHAMVIKLLQKARAYDESKANIDDVASKKLVRKVPKVTKSVKRKDGDTKLSKSQKRFKQTGNLKDSISSFEQFL